MLTQLARDAADGLLPPLFRGQELDCSQGAWEEARATAESPSVFIGNVDRNVTQKLLAELCAQMGPVDSAVGNAVRLLKDQRTGLSKGAGFCDFADADSAKYAIAVLNDFSFAGQRLRVNPAGGGGPNSAAPAAGAFARPQWDMRNDADEYGGEGGGGRSRRHEEGHRATRQRRRSRSRSRSRSPRRRDERDARWEPAQERWGERGGGRWDRLQDRYERRERDERRGGDERRWDERDERRWAEERGGRSDRDEREAGYHSKVKKHCDRPQSGTETPQKPSKARYNRFMDSEVFSKS